MFKNNYFFQLLKTRWVFNKPKIKKFLIYDGETSDIVESYFPKKDTGIFYIRKEEINLYVLFKVLLKTGFKNFFSNYQKVYFEYSKPKFVINLLDINVNFYKLKKNFPQIIFIGIQKLPRLAERELTGFVDQKDLKCDYFFTISKFHAKAYESYVDIKEIIQIGSFVNNHFPFKEKKSKKILFIPGCSSAHVYETDLITFNLLADYAKLKKINSIDVLLKPGMLQNDKNLVAMKFLEKKLGKKINFFKFLGGGSREKNYFIASQYKNIIFNRSTMGYECLAKNSRVIALSLFSKPPKHDWCHLRNEHFNEAFYPLANSDNFPKEGFCWSEDSRPEKFFALINSVLEMSDSEWDNKVNQTFGNSIMYDPGNKIFSEFINKIDK